LTGPASEPRLELIDLPAQHVRAWDDGIAAVYDARCAETHVLEGAAFMVFEWLREAPATRAEVIARLRREEAVETADAAAFIDQLITELERRHLLQTPAARR